MNRDELGDLAAFLAVAEAQSFTKAAARTGTSQSALSHTVKRLEARLGIRLLSRTTRRVLPTEAGERLAASLRPCLDEIETQVAALGELRDSPAGLVRLTSSALAAETILWPALSPLLAEHKELKIEIAIDQRFTDIVAERFDAGVRLGESLEKDMIAVPIGPDMRMALVAAHSGGRDEACLHQPAAGHAGRPLCLGIRERRPRAECPRQRPAYVQFAAPMPCRRAGRARPDLVA